MKNKWNIPIALLAVCGLSVTLYPAVSRYLSARNHSSVIKEYQVTAAQITQAAADTEFSRACTYNQNLQGGLITDPFSFGDDTGGNDYYLSTLNINGAMGFISIPDINIKLPIYHTTSDEVLKKGVGHMEFSSLPIGGKGTHSVLTAHRGLPSSKLFSDLNKLEIGKYFYVHVLNQTMVYEVDQILIVEPDITEPLYPSAGKDYVTLVTCTPYAVNSHRMFVRGVRTEEIKMALPETQTNVSGKLLWLTAGSAGSALIALLIRKKKRRKKSPNNL